MDKCLLKNLAKRIKELRKLHKMTQDDFRRRISAATLEKKETPTIIFYTINGSNFTENFPEEDFNNEIVVF
jgi:transcriptional regulator with XRE-family HTH domain